MSPTIPAPKFSITIQRLTTQSIRYFAAMLMTLALCNVAQAQLATGTQAPVFTAQAALAGQPFEFNLQTALNKGPAVVYFYPKAFTSGCTIEAQLFAQSMDDFNALNATVIGVSNDDIETLQKFSEGPCGGKFAVVADSDGSIIDAYDAGFAIIPGMADRVSFAIAPDGTILNTFDSMSPSQHVSQSLQAIRAWHAKTAGQAK